MEIKRLANQQPTSDGRKRNILRTQPWDTWVFEGSPYASYKLIGDVGSGKSMFGNLLAERYLCMGFIVYDWLANDVDYENLNWALPGKQGLSYPVLFVHSPYTRVTIPPPLQGLIKEDTDKTNLYTLVKTCAEENRVFVFANASYQPSEYQEVLLRWFEEIFDVQARIKQEYGLSGCIIMRELYKILPSQGSSKESEEGPLIAQRFRKLVKERRHGPLAIIVDFQRDMDVHKSVRDMMGTTVIRRSPDQLLPEDLRWVNKELFYWKLRARMNNAHQGALDQTYPYIKELTKTQAYVVKTTSSKFTYINNIPLPKHGDFDPTQTDIEHLLGIRITLDPDLIENRLESSKGVDYAFWMQKIQQAFVRADGPLIPKDLMKEIGWDGTDINGFRKMVGELRWMGFLLYQTSVRDKLPPIIKLASDVLSLEDKLPAEHDKAVEEINIDATMIEILKRKKTDPKMWPALIRRQALADGINMPSEAWTGHQLKKLTTYKYLRRNGAITPKGESALAKGVTLEPVEELEIEDEDENQPET